MSYQTDVETYTLDRANAEAAWIVGHVERFRELAGEAMSSYRGELGGFRRRMAILSDLFMAEARFPTFTQWLAAKYPAEKVA